ncbi:MAG TPA: serine hydrolase domain-containing protein [Kofleriaceae bacterium]|nr:serine hydrolase domain-containing protein [Kofleriaceae bacterium]
MVRAAAISLALAACGSPMSAPRDAPGAPDSAPDAAGLDLTSQLAPIAAQYQLPAMAGIAASDSAILGQGVTGVRKLGDPTPATLDDTWHLGSDTKAMTSTLIAGYVEAGTLGWDEPLSQLFPGTTIDPGYQSVTLRMLLAHVGGAPADLPTAVEQVIAGPGTSRALRLQAVQMILAQPPGATVGTYTYSNAGYMIAGAALELATNTAWEDLMRAKLFAPLQMTSCGFGPNATGTMVDEPWGHELENGTLVAVNLDNPPALGPAGTVHCGLVDWLAFLREHLNGARGAPTVLGLQPATWTELHTPYPGSAGSYALGWGVVTQSWTNGPALAHTGDNTFNVADAWVVPGIDRIFVATSNRGDQPALDGANAAIVSEITEFLPQ